MKTNKLTKYLLIFVALFLSLGILYQVKNPNLLAKESEISPTRSGQDLFLERRTQEHTQESIAKFRSSADVKDRVLEEVLNYRMNFSNAFFSKKDFFAAIEISEPVLSKLFSNLASIEGLEEVVFAEERDGPVSPLIEKRMAIIDFVRDYAWEKELERPQILANLRELSTAPIPSNASEKVKRIFFGEKVDLIRALTVLDKEAGLETMLSIPEPVRTEYRVAYYLGLEAAGLSSEEYQEWVDKLIN